MMLLIPGNQKRLVLRILPKIKAPQTEAKDAFAISQEFNGRLQAHIFRKLQVNLATCGTFKVKTRDRGN